MKSSFTYLLIPCLVLLVSTQMAAQPIFTEQNRPRWLGNSMADSTSYVFVETDPLISPLYELLNWGRDRQLLDLATDRRYWNIAVGYQHNNWFGLGLHYNNFSRDDPGIDYYGVGITYRLTSEFWEFRTNVGLLTSFSKSGEGFCSYRENPKVNPYFNFWGGVLLFEEFRIGGYLSYVPSTVKTEVTCSNPNSGQSSVRQEKVGAPLTFMPSVGFTAPIFRSDRERRAPDEKPGSYIFAEVDLGFFHDIYGYFSLVSTLSLGYQYNPWLGFGVHSSSLIIDEYGGSTFSATGLLYRLKYDMFQIRIGGGWITKYKQTDGDQTCTYDTKLSYNPFFNAWAGIILKNVFRLGAHFVYAPETIDTRITCFAWDPNRKSVRDVKRGAPFKVVPSLGFSVPLVRFAGGKEN